MVVEIVCQTCFSVIFNKYMCSTTNAHSIFTHQLSTPIILKISRIAHFETYLSCSKTTVSSFKMCNSDTNLNKPQNNLWAKYYLFERFKGETEFMIKNKTKVLNLNRQVLI